MTKFKDVLEEQKKYSYKDDLIDQIADALFKKYKGKKPSLEDAMDYLKSTKFGTSFYDNKEDAYYKYIDNIKNKGN